MADWLGDDDPVSPIGGRSERDGRHGGGDAISDEVDRHIKKHSLTRSQGLFRTTILGEGSSVRVFGYRSALGLLVFLIPLVALLAASPRPVRRIIEGPKGTFREEPHVLSAVTMSAGISALIVVLLYALWPGRDPR